MVHLEQMWVVDVVVVGVKLLLFSARMPVPVSVNREKKTLCGFKQTRHAATGRSREARVMVLFSAFQ